MTRSRDILTGTALVVLGIVMALIARGFPTMAGMAFGPDLFPTIIAGGLVLSGLGVLLEAWRGTGPAAEARADTHWLPFAVLLGVVAAFALTLDWLGFHLASALALVVSVRVFGGAWWLAVLIALAGPFALHAVFYTLLRVPLPWGLLTPVAW